MLEVWTQRVEVFYDIISEFYKIIFCDYLYPEASGLEKLGNNYNSFEGSQ